MALYKEEIRTTLTEKATKTTFEAIVKVRADGYGDVFDLDGNEYAGGLNPIRIIQLKREKKQNRN